jgi:hypothetical protein
MNTSTTRSATARETIAVLRCGREGRKPVVLFVTALYLRSQARTTDSCSIVPSNKRACFHAPVRD